MSERAPRAAGPSRPMPLLFLGVLTLALIWTVRLPDLNGWDDRFYVAQMVSMVSDGDLMLHDDLLAFESVAEGARLRPVVDINPARDGALATNFGIGPAVIHSLYLWPRLIGTAGLPASLRSDVALGSIFLLALTLLAIRTLLLDLGFASPVASSCAFAAAFAGPLAIYGTRLQMNSHLPSALCGALILLFAWRFQRDGGGVTAILLGLTCGLAAIVRFQDALVGLALAPFVITGLSGSRDDRRRRLAEIGLAALALAAPLAVQALIFDRHNGRVEGIPQGESYMHWTDPQLWNFLLSPVHGLAPWTPFFALGLLAVTYAAWRSQTRERRWFFAGLAFLAAAECYVSAAPTDWWGGSSFGARRLSTLTAVAAIGLATIAVSVPRRLAIAGLFVALGWSVWVAGLFTLRFDDLSLVLSGHLAPESPFARAEYGVPSSLTWSAFRPFLTDTFSLVDHTPPSILERLTGALACGALCLGAGLVWRAFDSSTRVRNAVTALATGWMLVWLVAVWRAPSNEAVNRAWLAMDHGTATEKDLASLPPEVSASGRVLMAWRAVRADRIEEARGLLSRARTPQFPAIGLAELALLDESVVRKGEH